MSAPGCDIESPYLRASSNLARLPDTVQCVDPVRNPYAPGAGQRPPELAGRDRELDVFDVVLERVPRGRPERSLVLTGLRGVGKTVLLNTLRSEAIGRLWGTGKIEARPDQSLRRPLSAALHMAVRELAPHHRAPDRVDAFLVGAQGVRAAQQPDATPSCATAGSPASTCRPRSAGPTPATSRSTWSSCSPTRPAWPPTSAPASRCSSTRCRTCPATDVSALCAACHELSQTGAPLIVVGAGLPHLPAVAVARPSPTPSGCSDTSASIGSTGSRPTRRCARRPPGSRWSSRPKALDALYEASGGYPYFVQAYGKATWDHAPQSPITAADVRVAAPEAEAELAVGLLRFPVRAGHAGRARVHAGDGDARRTRRRVGRRRSPPSEVARALERKPASLSPARDALIKKGLIYCGERGTVAFTVPHFGRYLRTQPAPEV